MTVANLVRSAVWTCLAAMTLALASPALSQDGVTDPAATPDDFATCDCNAPFGSACLAACYEQAPGDSKGNTSKTVDILSLDSDVGVKGGAVVSPTWQTQQLKELQNTQQDVQ